MKDLFKLLLRFVPPYKRYLILNILFNLLSTLLSIFSFMLIIPILEILFKTSEATYTFIPWNEGDLKDIVINNFYWFVAEQIKTNGAIIRRMAHRHDLCQNHDCIPEFGLHHTFARRCGTRHSQLCIPQGGKPADRLFHKRA